MTFEELLNKLARLRNVRLTEDREHNLRVWLVEHGIPPTPDVLASFAQKSDKRAQSAESKPINAKSNQPWYESSPDILRRRQIVLKNPTFPSKSFCKLFDTEGIPLPADWEQKFSVTTWLEAYKNKKARALIQKLVSTDKNKR